MVLLREKRTAESNVRNIAFDSECLINYVSAMNTGAQRVLCSIGFKFVIGCCSFSLFTCLPKLICFPGDEVGESELLGEALQLESSVAKAERSHLIVWQVMCGSE